MYALKSVTELTEMTLSVTKELSGCPITVLSPGALEAPPYRPDG
jgi:hypothetical protein